MPKVDLIKLYAFPGDTVLDPFSGSGTTGVAALKLGCNYIGIDKEEKYTEIARRRIRDEEVRFAQGEIEFEENVAETSPKLSIQRMSQIRAVFTGDN